MSLYNNILPAWSLGNPFGPIPTDGKYYYIDGLGERKGPFNSLLDAMKDMEEIGAKQKD